MGRMFFQVFQTTDEVKAVMVVVDMFSQKTTVQEEWRRIVKGVNCDDDSLSKALRKR